MKQFYDIIETGYVFADVQVFDVGTEPVNLPTRLFYKDDLVINHISGNTLAITDYTVGDLDQPLTTLFGKNVYKKLYITTPAYRTGMLSIDFTGVGDYLKSTDIGDIMTAVAGKVDQSGGAIEGNITTRDILPSMIGSSGGVSLRSIGSETAKYKAVYADEVFVGASSLYVNGKKVIEDVSSVIEFKTDMDQGLALKTTSSVPGSGNGNIALQSENEINLVGRGGVEITVPTGVANKDVVISTASSGGRVELSAPLAVNITAPQIGLTGTVQATDIIVSGNLTVSGTTTTLNTTTVTLHDNIIELNKDQTGVPSASLISGIEVNRGDSTKYRFVFQESNDTFRVGEQGSEQAVATRQDAPAANGVAFWNNVNSRFDTFSGLTFNGTNLMSTQDLLVKGQRVVTCGQGTAFPVLPGFGDEFYRTDLDEWYKYNGATWTQI